MEKCILTEGMYKRKMRNGEEGEYGEEEGLRQKSIDRQKK